jgi:hypothetical protein
LGSFVVQGGGEGVERRLGVVVVCCFVFEEFFMKDVVSFLELE